MWRPISLGLFLLTLASTAGAAVDLTPFPREYVEEGVRVVEVTLQANPGTVRYFPPREWSVTGSKDRLQVTPREKNFSEGLILAAPLPEPRPLDEATRQAFEQQVLATLPAGSQKVEVVLREENTVILNGHHSYQVVVAYHTLGQDFLRSSILVHYPHTQLVFRFSAPKTDFEALNKAFRRSISSWNWTEPAGQAAAAPAAP